MTAWLPPVPSSKTWRQVLFVLLKQTIIQRVFQIYKIFRNYYEILLEASAVFLLKFQSAAFSNDSTDPEVFRVKNKSCYAKYFPDSQLISYFITFHLFKYNWRNIDACEKLPSLNIPNKATLFYIFYDPTSVRVVAW